MTAPGFQWHITPTAAGLAAASRALAEWLAMQGAPEAGIGRVELVLEEVVMNIILHGAPPSGSARIHITAAAEAAACQLQVFDNGPAFDPGTAPLRPDGAALDQATPGGLGLVLLRRYAQGLRHVRQPGGNHLAVTIPYASPAATSPLPPGGTLR